MTGRIVIVGYGVGNLGAIPNMLKRLGASATTTSDPDVIFHAEKLILPGVGSFDAAMGSLVSLGLVEPLNERARAGIPILGLCLGMEVFADRSEEGDLPGLGWIPGTIVRFRLGADAGLAVPHMGWSYVTGREDLDLLRGLETRARYYFAHSYHFEPSHGEHVVATADYGYTFPAIVRNGNITGIQFHPEKSHRFGLRLFENFLAAG